MNSEVIFIAGLITADHIFLKNEKNWDYIGSIGGGSAANVYFALKSFGVPVKLIGAVGNKKPNILNIALKDINSNSKNNNIIHISEDAETREYYHLIKKSNNHWNHKFSSNSPVSNKKQAYSVQFRKSFFMKEFKNSIDECKLFYMDRLSKSLLEFAELAKEKKIRLIFDLGTISTRYLKENLIRRAIEIADIVQVPKKLFTFLCKNLKFKNFQELNPNISIWIITDGKKPIRAYHINIGEISCEVEKIENVIDSAGAGDAFMAMLIKQIFDLNRNNKSLENIDKKQFIKIIQNCIKNARKACLFIGSRTYIYDYINNLKKFSGLNEYLNDYKIEGEKFEKSINLIENFGKKIQDINDENQSNKLNEKISLRNKGKGVFENNLLNIPKVFDFALKNYENYIKTNEFENFGDILIIIGSGASYSVAKAMQQLFNPPNQKFSVYAYTPFEYILKIQENYPICLISYSGTNSDVKSCFKRAIDIKSKQIFLLTGNLNSLLASKIKNSKNNFILPVITPKEERGFVGVYSMFSSLCILAKFLYKEEWDEKYTEFLLQKNLKNLIERHMKHILDDIYQKLNMLHIKDKFHIVALGTNWAEPALIDLESKIVECNLGTIEVSELKNYTHGRYINLFKNPDNRIVVIFKTPETKDLAEFIDKKLSKVSPVVSLETNSNDFIGMVDLHIQMLVFVNALGKIYNQDPSKPGFPNEAKGLYNWNGLY
ncbi:hypothetical protein LCGC14_0459940 [marine sediment metagenome]|uniref:SIS domain-containing protein n=1 Tax=marine sediment metagenome TaxID=412755 RepID=A0A0F9V256_9ZZZZ|nr:hypothetical protein [bacterium]